MLFEEQQEISKDIKKSKKQLKMEKRKQEEARRLKEQQDREFYFKRYQVEIESLKECKKRGISIYQASLDLLEDLGFQRKELGTRLLADLAEYLYHERSLYDKDNEYFDLSDIKNNHYVFAKDDLETEVGLKRLFKEVNKSIESSYMSGCSIDVILYEVANDLISQFDRTSQNLVQYQKIK